jgi:ribose transport system substrate-binding protein
MNSRLFHRGALGGAAAWLLLAAWPGCGSPGSQPGGPTVTIGVTMSTFTSPYASATIRELNRCAREKGCGLILLDAEYDIQREAFNIDNFMAKRVDAILVIAVDSKGSRAALRKAARRGFPVICCNATVDEPQSLGVRAYSGPNCYQEAVNVAEFAMRHRPHGKAVMITGDPGFSVTNERQQGFLDAIARRQPGIRMLDIQTANFMRENAQRIMSDFITKYGRQIDIVYGQDDNMTAGAINALKAAGYTLADKPLVVSIGAMADGLPLVQEGWIDGTIMQSPRDDARLALDTALRIAAGKQADPFQSYFINTYPVDKKNVQEAVSMHLWDD